MVASMTAYARHSGQGDWGRATWELRSVNHRYLEVSLRLPEELRPLETRARERIDQALRRGKIDCTLKFEAASGRGEQLSVNTELVRQLIDACAAIGRLVDRGAPPAALDLLRWPGVIATDAPDADTIAAALLPLLDEALRVLVDTRRREGDKLKALIEDRCAEAEQRVAQLRTQLPAIMDGLKTRMQGRIAELAPTAVDPGRLEQEVALLLQKFDVAEEMDRLQAHFGEVRRVLREDQVAGRRLDFLMQEMNREANTLGSKSAHLDTTGASVALKVLIEQMREQVQNVE
jgi:uncharacterized protein (TIGR00255 family)